MIKSLRPIPERRTRTRDGLSQLDVRYWNRAEELRTIADTMTTGESNTLRRIADQWDDVARQLRELEELELKEPLLG